MFLPYNGSKGASMIGNKLIVLITAQKPDTHALSKIMTCVFLKGLYREETIMILVMYSKVGRCVFCIEVMFSRVASMWFHTTYLLSVQYWSLLNWQKLRLRCGCVAVPVIWFFDIISSFFAKFTLKRYVAVAFIFSIYLKPVLYQNTCDKPSVAERYIMFPPGC